MARSQKTPMLPNDADGPYGSADGNDLIPYLAKQKIIVRDRRDIAPGHIRISIGTQEQMERLLKLIKRFQKSR